MFILYSEKSKREERKEGKREDKGVRGRRGENGNHWKEPRAAVEFTVESTVDSTCPPASSDSPKRHTPDKGGSDGNVLCGDTPSALSTCRAVGFCVQGELS